MANPEQTPSKNPGPDWEQTSAVDPHPTWRPTSEQSEMSAPHRDLKVLPPLAACRIHNATADDEGEHEPED
jgi:hypothetical protein